MISSRNNFLKGVFITLSITFITYETSNWLKEIINQNLVISVFFLLATLTGFFSVYRNSFFNKLLFVIFFLFLVILQIQTTDIKSEYTFTPSEVDLQITRMNYYPPRNAKLGYILENKREINLLRKAEENFFEVIDTRNYFPDYFSYIYFPFFILGILSFVKDKTKIFTNLWLVSILLFTIIGIHGKYGPFALFPLISVPVFIFLFKLIKVSKHYEI